MQSCDSPEACDHTTLRESRSKLLSTDQQVVVRLDRLSQVVMPNRPIAIADCLAEPFKGGVSLREGVDDSMG